MARPGGGETFGELFVRFIFGKDDAGLRSVESTVERTRRRLNKAASITFRIGAAGVAAFTTIAATSIKTDRAMRNLASRTKLTEEQLDQLYWKARRVGSDLPLNNDKIVDAATGFIQYGNSFKDAVAAMQPIALAAVADGIASVDDVAGYASIALKAFKRPATDAGVALDAMLKTTTTTGVKNLDAIGGGLRYSAQSAADAKLPMEGYIATLGVLGTSGRTAEESSQGLNAMLTKMATAMNDFGRGGKLIDEAFGAIGLESEEVLGAMESGRWGFVNLMKLISAQAKNLPQHTMTAFWRALVGEGYTSSFSFMLQNMELLEDSWRNNFDALGESERQAKEKMKGLSGAVDLFKAQWNTLQNDLGKLELNAPLERLLRSGADLIAWLTETKEIVQEDGQVVTEFVREGLLRAVGATIKWATAMLAVSVALRVFSFLLGGLVPLMRLYSKLNIGKGLSKLAKGLGLAGRAGGGAAGGIARVGSVMLRFVPVVGWIVAAATLLYLAWNPIKTFFLGLAGAFRDGSSQIGQAFSGLGTALSDLLTALGPIGDAVKYVFDGIGLAWSAMVSVLKEADLTEWGKNVGGFLVDVITDVIDVLSGLIETATAVVNFFKKGSKIKAVDVAKEFWERTRTNFKEGRAVEQDQSIFDAAYNRSMLREITLDPAIKARPMVEGVAAAAQETRDYLPGSDAKRGPLSNIMESGRALIDTFTEGMRQATPVGDSIAGALAMPAMEAVAARVIPEVDRIGDLGNQAMRVLPEVESIGDLGGQAMRVLPEVESIGDLGGQAMRVLPEVESIGDLGGQAMRVLPEVESIGDLGGQAMRVLPEVEGIGDLGGQAMRVLPEVEGIGDLGGQAMRVLPEVEGIGDLGGQAMRVLPEVEGIGDLGESALSIFPGGLTAPLPVGPSPDETQAVRNETQVATREASGGDRSVTMQFGDGAIQISVPGGDADDIARALKDKLAEEFRNTVETRDSRILV